MIKFVSVVHQRREKLHSIKHRSALCRTDVLWCRLIFVVGHFMSSALVLPFDHLSIKQTLEPFQRQRWGNFRETWWSAYGLFWAHRYHLELNWTELTICREHPLPQVLIKRGNMIWTPNARAMFGLRVLLSFSVTRACSLAYWFCWLFWWFFGKHVVAIVLITPY